MKQRHVLFWVLLVGAALAIGLVAGPPANGGPALDPRSTAADGTKALVLLLGQLGAQVQLSAQPPPAGTDVAVVLVDQLSDDRRQALAAWLEQGGTLVVADPRSDLQRSAPVRRSGGYVADGSAIGPCPSAGLGDVGRIDTGRSYFLALPAGATGCFASGEDPRAYFLSTVRVGRGRLWLTGGAAPFTNSLLGKADNSVLASDLLLPRPGAKVEVLLRSPVGGGHRSIWQLLNRPTKLVLFELMLAFAVVALWRGRRFGAPVEESQPVQLAGSELIGAVGDLQARAGHRDAAAASLRRGLRRWLAQRFGLAITAAPDNLADVASARTGVDRASLLALLEDQPLGSEGELVELAQSIEHAREEVAHGRV